MPNPYGKDYTLPETDISTSISSAIGSSAEYVTPGDYDFDSIAENFNGNIDYNVKNSNGDVWNIHNKDIPAEFNIESKESMKTFYDVMYAEEKAFYDKWEFKTSLALSGVNMSVALGLSMQKRYFSDNFDQLAAIAGNKNPIVAKEIQSLENSIGKNLKNLKTLRTVGNLSGIAGAAVGVWSIGTDIHDGLGRYEQWSDIIDSIQTRCTGDDTDSLVAKATEYRKWIANSGNLGAELLAH